MDQENMSEVPAETPASVPQPAPMPQATMVAALPGFGTLFSGAWKHFMGHFGLFASLYLVPAIIALVGGLLYPNMIQSGGGMMVVGVILAIVTFFVAIVGQLALFIAISNPTQSTFGSSISSAIKRFLPYFWFSMVSGIIIIGMFGLAIIPGIIFAVYFSTAIFIFVVEDVRGMNALTKSLNYVWGHWWGVFGRLLLFGIIVAGIYWSIFLIVARLDNGIAGFIIIVIIPTLLQILVTPFSYAFIFKLYESLRLAAGPVEINSSASYKAKFVIPALIGIVLLAIFVRISLNEAMRAETGRFPSSSFESGLDAPETLDKNKIIENFESQEVSIPTSLPVDISPVPAQ